MKKNITINICGTIYSIDEDAYQLLEHYLDSMKRYFSQEGDEDIADDIEHRVAELLWEQKQQGRDAVNLAMVKDIIGKIGNPSDIADETTAHEETQQTNETTDESAETTEESTSNSKNFKEKVNEFANDASEAASNAYEKVKSNTKGKRLYRDSSNEMIGGVCSGLAEFFGGDPVVWRLGTVLLAILFWGGVDHLWFVPRFMTMAIPILYMCMLIVVPAAKTPEDRIRMKGGEVNPETLKDQVMCDMETRQQAPQQVNNVGSGCLKLIFGIVLLCILFPLFATFIGLLFALLLAIPTIFGATSAIISVFPGLHWLPEMITSNSPILILGIVSGLYLVGLPIYGIIRLLRNTNEHMKSSTVITLIITWILALALTVIATVFFGLKLTTYLDEFANKEMTIDENDIEEQDDLRWLDDNGWTMGVLDNAEGDFVASFTHLQGFSDRGICINREDTAEPMSIEMAKDDYYTDGTYVLEAVADVRGQGCTFSASDENVDPQEVVDPNAPDYDGKVIKGLSFEDFSKLPIVSEPDSVSWEGINGDADEEWKYYCSAPFKHERGNMTINIKATDALLKRVHIRMIRLRKVD